MAPTQTLQKRGCTRRRAWHQPKPPKVHLCMYVHMYVRFPTTPVPAFSVRWVGRLRRLPPPPASSATPRLARPIGAERIEGGSERRGRRGRGIRDPRSPPSSPGISWACLGPVFGCFGLFWGCLGHVFGCLVRVYVKVLQSNED